MAFLHSKKKQNLIDLDLIDLGLIIEAGLNKPKLKDLIVKSPDYVEEDVKVMFDSIVEDRISKESEEKEEKLRREEREYELEKLRIQARKNINTMNNSENVKALKFIHETFRNFNMKDDIKTLFI
ncbi:transposon Tf2-6 polyprotein [Trichonephila inaurata madagascariensis]|uniref:Transposon Tf2-6 polyprotein n=1 Tax=Trichonephila inaurata madagascariensis TaxID=2747483 RepID=A0A8X6XMQ2_9ARAC|nr:transposon Tf2-6 polyprotein [Trichonephila inaurata madagascariensis]GFY56813.1 transposon Tf2-6 polyprotein [Trichonephila inaurata madagascariensis]